MVRLLLRWLIAWASLAQGIVGVLTLGFWIPSWQLAMARVLAKHAHTTIRR